MNTLRNSVQLIGHLGKTPELITLEKGRLVAKATLATHETYTSNNGEHITNTHWHKLVAWGPLAENMSKILEKGTQFLLRVSWLPDPMRIKMVSQRRLLKFWFLIL
jgi:single-strand DNA-binding protein